MGVWLSRRHGDFRDYFLAGGALTTPILVCTLVSTYYGIDVLLGDSGLAYDQGIVAFFGYSVPTYAFYVIAALVISRRLKREDFVSLPDILLKYYGENTQLLGAIASFLYSIPALSLFGFGLVTHVVFGWNPMLGAAVLGSTALVYTLLGGLWAVALTDALQFFLMCVTLAFAVPIALTSIGGFDWLQGKPRPELLHTHG